jgi:hypothetical protein
MIFIEYSQSWKNDLRVQKQNEIMARVKKPCQYINSSLESNHNSTRPIRIVDLKIGEDGGLWTYLEGKKEPVRTYPDQTTVNTVSCYKSLLPRLLTNLSKIGWTKRIITLLSIKYNLIVFSEYLGMIYGALPLLLKDEYYSVPVKEIRRVLRGQIDRNILDAVSLIFEYDSAYRYRFQDVIVNLNKEKINGYFSVIKEISRLFDILISREPLDNGKESGMSKKFKKLKSLIKLLMLNPKVNKLVRYILLDVDLYKLQFSKEDIYWVNQFNVYKYRGLTIEERNQENIKNYGGIS